MSIKDKLKEINADVIRINDEGLKTSSENVDSSSTPHENFGGNSQYNNQSNKAEMPRGADKVINEKGIEEERDVGALPHSQFSDYHLFRARQLNGQNYPLFNTDKKDPKNSHLYKNVTAQSLISNPIGSSIYKAEDFIYLERFKKLPLNRLITLRRFAYPCVDDIFSSTVKDDEPDMSRMLTYSDQEINKLGEIMSFSMGMRWKELKSSMEEMQMHGTRAGVGGYMKNVMKYIDPTFGQDQIKGDNRLDFNPMHDSNKVYGMVDSIDSSHIRDIGLNFDQEFKLVFKYKMKSYNGINGKAAFMDLLSNILLCCTNDAKFWAGARFWRGRRPTKYMKNLKGLAPNDFNDFLNKAHVEFKGFLSKGSGDTKKDALNMLKTVANNVFNMGFGALLDKIGRPSIPFSNSLLTNSPVGNWHVTVGNPMNPMMVMGNLLLTNTTITFGETLGHDDFPEDITVECNLKHAMPRGRAEIEQMFNSGRGRMYWKPKDIIGSLNNKGGSDVDLPFGSFGNINPKTLNEAISSQSKFGQFDKDAVMRNAQEVWSFDKLKK